MFIPEVGRSRGLGLLLFGTGWAATSADETTANGSISQGETLSGLLIDAGSSH